MDAIAEFSKEVVFSRPLLFAGAGLSASVGYPTWPRLIETLSHEFAPEKPLPKDLRRGFDVIEASARSAGRLEYLHKALDRTFRRERRASDLEPIRRLLRIGFCGVATTNFDTVLEDALFPEFVGKDGYPSGVIDLCANKPYEVSEYLRRLNGNHGLSNVLHLHGVHSSPATLVLGETSFSTAYGCADGSRVIAPNTLHSRTLRDILANHLVLFVGFNLADPDPFFMTVLDFVNQEFRLTDEKAFFAVLPVEMASSNGEVELAAERQRIQEKIRTELPGTIKPIFYDVIDRDYAGLYALADQIAAATNDPLANSRAKLIARRKEER